MSGCDIRGMAEAARAAARALASASGDHKNRALLAMADGLVAARERLLTENAEDVAAARAEGQASAFVDRLTLTELRIEGMARGVRQVAELP
ncbi:MAG: glutamate-5-semialdehyde dehydrogenase, partial [candidate division NC10 bacterium]|nr:glutamate-5-semialdehyde dehydrogenase [candidate division NC10 bacterium]